jgi:transposase InsO family protein
LDRRAKHVADVWIVARRPPARAAQKGYFRMDTLTPKDDAEAVALYRAQIIGSVCARELSRGELQTALAELSDQRFRPPRAHSPRSYSIATLERWYYAYKQGGLEALRPEPRADKGRGRDLAPEVRELLLAIRQEHPHASVPLILSTLIREGRLAKDAVSESTVRRFFAQHGLDRVSLRAGGTRGKVRLRWQAERPMALWQGDVCHGTPIVVSGENKPVRIHALLDDASRYVVAIEAMHAEREVDMLALLVRAVRRHGPPDALYLDNGSTYRGQTLALACARMGTALLHAKPYDAPARGKMERFWRTLREGCLDHTGSLTSLHDLNVRIWAWLDGHYHATAHGALMGASPGATFDAVARTADSFDENRLRAALTVHARRRVRRDSTLSMDGEDWETDLHFLAGRLVTVSRCLVDPQEPPSIEHEGKRSALHKVDPIRNATRSRSASSHDAPHEARVPFDPPRALLDRQLGRAPRGEGGDQ